MSFNPAFLSEFTRQGMREGPLPYLQYYCTVPPRFPGPSPTYLEEYHGLGTGVDADFPANSPKREDHSRLAGF